MSASRQPGLSDGAGRASARVAALALLCWISGADPAIAAAEGATAKHAVQGVVSVRVASVSADIEVKAGSNKVVVVTVKDTSVSGVSFVETSPGELEVMFDGMAQLRDGRVILEVPVGTALRAAAVSGDVKIHKIGGVVRARSTSGNIDVGNATEVEAANVSGRIKLTDVSGAIKAQSVSGDIRIKSTGPKANLRAKTTSGEVDWRGTCAVGCDLEIQTLSGDVDVRIDKTSTFDVEFASFSGDFDNEVPIKLLRSRPNHHGGARLEGRYADGKGSIQVHTFSGEFTLSRAR